MTIPHSSGRARPHRALLALLLAAHLVACASAVRSSPAADGSSLRVMTFNVRYAHSAPPNAWPDRRPVLRETIAREAPDVIGTQEGLYQQLRDIEADLSGFAWIGIGRDGGSRGEFMAVFYRRDRLEPLEFDHYWLSDTPEVIGSRTWGNSYPRMVTWVRFRDRRGGREFIFVNTHFDHQAQPARERSAELIVQRSERWGDSVPVILAGDFNVTAGANPVYDTIVKGGRFTDTWTAGGRPEGLGTFHNFKGVDGARGAARIDWILTRGPVAATSAAIVTFAHGAQYPSDHFPVVARLVWR